MPEISEIPDEILRHIFALGCQDYPRFKLSQDGRIDSWSDWRWGLDGEPRRALNPNQVNRRLPMRFAALSMRVCVRWQEIVVSTSSLYYTRISLNCSGLETLNDPDISPQIAVLVSALRASQGSDLYAHLIISSRCSIRARRLFCWGLAMLAEYSRQIRCVQVVCTHSDDIMPYIMGLLSRSSNVASFIHTSNEIQEVESNASLGTYQDLYHKLPRFIAASSDTAPDFPLIGYLQASLPMLMKIPLPRLELIQGLVIGDSHADWDATMRILSASHQIRLLHLVGRLSFSGPRNGIKFVPPTRTYSSIFLPSLRTLRLEIKTSSLLGFFQRVILPSLEHLILAPFHTDIEDAVRLSSDERCLSVELPALRILQVEGSQPSVLQAIPALRCPSPLSKLFLIVVGVGDIPVDSQNQALLPAAREVEIVTSARQTYHLLHRISNPEFVEVLRISVFGSGSVPYSGEKLPYRLRILAFAFGASDLAEDRDLFVAVCSSSMPACLEVTIPSFIAEDRWKEFCQRCQAAFEGLLELTFAMPPYKPQGFHPLKTFRRVKMLRLLIWFNSTPAKKPSLPTLDGLQWLVPISANSTDTPMPKLRHLRILIVSKVQSPIKVHDLEEIKERLDKAVRWRGESGCVLAKVTVEQRQSSTDGQVTQTLMVLDKKLGRMVYVSE